MGLTHTLGTADADWILREEAHGGDGTQEIAWFISGAGIAPFSGEPSGCHRLGWAGMDECFQGSLFSFLLMKQ